MYPEFSLLRFHRHDFISHDRQIGTPTSPSPRSSSLSGPLNSAPVTGSVNSSPRAIDDLEPSYTLWYHLTEEPFA